MSQRNKSNSTSARDSASTALIQSTLEDESAVSQAMTIGKRYLKWIDFENEKPAHLDHPIRTSSPEKNENSNSIEKPMVYNAKIVRSDFEKILNKCPSEIKKVLLSSEDFPKELPVSEKVFVEFGKDFSDAYSNASRWQFASQDIYPYISAASRDMRGYYFLKKENWTSERLSHYQDLPNAKKAQLKIWLMNVCLNSSKTKQACELEFTSAVDHGSLGDFFTTYFACGRRAWDDFFTISEVDKRIDILPGRFPGITLQIPFQISTNPKMQKFVQENVEDEWKIMLNFVNSPSAPRLEFEDGATANVSGSGNIITLDQNTSIDEYDSQWTIRHEFGHVLGFKDCYVEFFDLETKEMVYYELDSKNIMCAMGGKVLPIHKKELNRAYFDHHLIFNLY